MNDLRYAIRQAVKRPGFSIVVVLMLALGIGSTTAMFSIFQTILLEPLPVPEPERLVNLRSPGPKWGMQSTGLPGGSEAVFSYPMFRDLESRQDNFTGLAAHSLFEANIAFESQTLSGAGVLVSGDYFSVLGALPALGRLIGPQDEPVVGESPVAVLSHAYWRRQFGGDPGVLGRTLSVNGESLTVIGVAPDGFSGTTLGLRPEVFVPLTMRWRMEPTRVRDDTNRRSYWLYLFARLRDGVSAERAAAELSAQHGGILEEVEVPLNADMPEETLEQFRNRQILIDPGARGQSFIRSGVGQSSLALLLGVTALVLLIACVNIANLLLARGAAREGEIALRASIGASRAQLTRQLLTETTVLAVIGGIASLPVAVATLRGAVGLVPAETARMFAIQINGTAVSFAIAATFVTLFLFGLLPALRASRTDPGLVIKDQSSATSGGRRAQRIRGTLATAQIALSTVLLVLAGLFTQSLANVARVELGMAVDSVATFAVAPRRSGYGREATLNFFDQLEEELAAQPGILDVGSSSVPVLTNTSMTRSLSVEGFESGPGIDSVAALNEVSPGFFSTLAIPLLAGRDFTDADRLDSPRVAIVNESFVRKFNLGSDPLGKRLAVGNTAAEFDTEIIGIVADAKYDNVKEELPPQYFLPHRQVENISSLAFYVRSGLGADTVLQAIPGIVDSLDPNLPVSGLSRLERQVRDNVYLDRMIAILSSAFAGLATLLAAIGLYGVLAYSIARRTRELGLRLALGATPGQLRKLVLSQVGRMAVVGGIAGLAAAVTLGQLAESMLFGVAGYDPVILVAAVVVLGAVVLGAGLLPAMRASRTAPMEALRHE
jgi:predicted permease